MSESNEKQPGFFGTYFDRDGVLRLARWAEIIAWVLLTIYILLWLSNFLIFLGQYFNGLYFDKGGTFLDTINMFGNQLLSPLPGVFYFFALQAVSKALLILLDMEDNTRRSARNLK